MIDRQRLERLLGADDLSWLIARVRRRVEHGESLDIAVTLSGATPAQRSAVQRLLGRPPRPGDSLTVSLAAVDDVIRRSGACPDGLAAAVVALTGEVTDKTAAAAELDRAWQAAFDPIEALVDVRPELEGWLDHLRRSGLVRRLAGTPQSAAALLRDLANVIRQLPAKGEPLGRFAARHARGAHALDDDRQLATLALGAARALSGLADGAGAQWRREVWASVGLLRDEVSTTVLTLGMPGDGTTATGRALAGWREEGQPVVLTLRQLVRDTSPSSVPRVFVCENPVVVSAAADQIGPECAPLVCTNGQPGAAVMHLLRGLATTGTRMYYHGDFDWGGVRIGNVVFDRLPAQPWRFRAADFRAAAHGRELAGTPVSALWDPDLAPAMSAAGIAVEEETVLDDLLADLA